MNRIMHVAITAVLALLSAFLLWIWLVSGASLCGVSICGFSPSHANISFGSLGILSALLFGVECFNLATRRRQWNIGFESHNQRQIRVIGFRSFLLGVPLTVYGFYEMNTGIMGCNASSCATLPSMYFVSFYLGICLIAAGALLMLMAKFVQPRLFKLPKIERALP